MLRDALCRRSRGAWLRESLRRDACERATLASPLRDSEQRRATSISERAESRQP